MPRRRIHGRKKRSPARFSYMSAPMGEEQTNYSPEEQEINARLEQQDEMERAEKERKQQKQLQDQQQRAVQQFQNARTAQDDPDGAHTHRRRESGLGGLIQLAGRGKQSQTQSPFYHKKKY